jgi:hypothetical protein
MPVHDSPLCTEPIVGECNKKARSNANPQLPAAVVSRGTGRLPTMKRFAPAFLLLLVLLIGYWAWPFLELRALAAALRTGDVPAINKEVDYTRLCRSFTEQIIDACLRVTGRASQLDALVL